MDDPSATIAKHTATKFKTADQRKSSLPFPSFGSGRSMACAYVFTFSFVACTIFFFFSAPSSTSSSMWFRNIMKNRSQFPTFFSHLFPGNTSSSNFVNSSQNSSFQLSREEDGISGKMYTLSKGNNVSSSSSVYTSQINETEVMESNVTVKGDLKIPSRNATWPTRPMNGWRNSIQNASVQGVGDKNLTSTRVKNDNVYGVKEKRMRMNQTSLLKKEDNVANSSSTAKQRGDASWDMMSQCNIFEGEWVRDDSYPLYKPGSCPHIDEPFNCFLNGRPDNSYENFRWQPNGCNIPRLNGKNMLELLRGKRLAYVGDSLNRNMWESMLCILRNSVEDKTKVFEASGRHEFRTEGSYSFIFTDYNCSLEYFRSPFLVQEWEVPEMNGSKKETLRLDLIERSSDRYKSADILVFNTGHWWTHEKTKKGTGYYQEGSHIYGELNVVEAFRKALTTWSRWVDANIDPVKTLVFFRGYSASHFRGGRWNSGGQCNNETEPFKNKAYLLKYPSKMRTLERVMKGMKTPVFYLNITRLTDYRKDAHPSVYRKENLTEEERQSPLRFQDCSHWCLPGVPDTWNELLYAQLLIKNNQKQ